MNTSPHEPVKAVESYSKWRGKTKDALNACRKTNVINYRRRRWVVLSYRRRGGETLAAVKLKRCEKKKEKRRKSVSAHEEVTCDV